MTNDKTPFPTAEEILVKNKVFETIGIEVPFNLQVDRDTHRRLQRKIKNAMIEFAKLHVQAALAAASENAYNEDAYIGDGDHEGWSVNTDSILNANDYPESSIK